MRYLHTRFKCRLLTDGILSAWKGSMLRGALGAQLRRAVCLTRKPDCAGCMLRQGCIFPRVFSAGAAPAGNSPQLTPPFAIIPEQDGKTAYQTGDELVFGLKLFGYGVEYLPFFVHALTVAGKHGLGKNNSAKFLITEITHANRNIYDQECGELLPCETEELCLPVLTPDANSCALEIRLVSPLRFKECNQFSSRMDFNLLLSLILRRIRALLALEGASFRLENAQYEAMRAAASAIAMPVNALCWRELGRYSNRQQTAMRLGGLVGKAFFSGPVTTFAEFLAYAQKAQIGKQTVFGLGRIEYDFLPG